MSDLDGFDVFCFADTAMPDLLIDADTDIVSAGSQVAVEGGTDDVVLLSGGTESTGDLRISVEKAIPETWTLQFTVKLRTLPDNFGDLTLGHVFFGATDAAGPCAGLFISTAGLAYAGAISHEGSGAMRLDSALEVLPGGQDFIELDRYLTFRVAADGATSAVYIYVTPADELAATGHRLRYILPVVDAGSLLHTALDRVLISVRGTVASPSEVRVDQLCLADTLVIPNLPPRANAGVDQAVRSCAIVQLDGRQSFDPEGALLSYGWRLIDAPPDSIFASEQQDGTTQPEVMPTGFTDRIYSVEAGAANALDAFEVGDALLIRGLPYRFIAVGTDMTGFYLQVEGSTIPDDVANESFKVLRQRGVVDATGSQPTFLPDQPGLYKFGLVVGDGDLTSEESFTIVNVLESPVPRGCIPDLGFLWQYLSDFWRLVEDRERIETFFQSMAQVAASELLTLWQVDYAKSLRDIQRTVQRRWLHYDLLLAEPLPELTVARQVWGGVTSSLVAAGGQSGVATTVLQITSPLLAVPILVTVVGTNPMTATAIADSLDSALQYWDSRFHARVLPRLDGAGYVRIDSEIPFTIGDATTLPIFTVGAVNTSPAGAGGVKVGPRTYWVPVSLENLAIQAGDILTVGGGAPAMGYRIARVVDDATDQFRYQRVVLDDDLPEAPGNDWAVPGHVLSRLLDFWAGLVSEDDHVTLEVADLQAATVDFFETRAIAPVEADPSRLALDLASVAQYLVQPDRYSVRLAKIVRRRYLPINQLVDDVPMLQSVIAVVDERQVLHRNVDYFFDEQRGQACLRFVVGESPDPDVFEYLVPPNRLWAETTYIDNRPAIQGNFGIQAGFTLEDLAEIGTDLDYLSAVRGLWYTLLKGPTLFNLRVGTQILLGLPFAEERGVIEEIRPTFSPTQGRVLLRDTASPEIVRSYQYPGSLALERNPATGARYQLGDTVEQFAPIVEGVAVVDYIKDPRWFEGVLNQGVFYEVEKFHKFLVQVDSPAFGISSLLFVQSFIGKVKPTYTLPLFVVRESLSGARSTEISVTDDITFNGTLRLFDGACFDEFGVATMWDDPRAAGGGQHNQLDANADPDDPPPTYPTSQPVAWGLDKKYLCPEEALTLVGTTAHAGGAVNTTGMFSSGSNVSPYYVFGGGALSSIAAGPAGTTFSGGGAAVVSNGNITELWVYIAGAPDGDPTDYTVVVQKDAGDVFTLAIDTAPTGYFIHHVLASPIAVTTANTLTVRVRPTTGGARTPAWATATAWLIEDPVVWSGSKPAGKYLQVSDGWPAPWY